MKTILKIGVVGFGVYLIIHFIPLTGKQTVAFGLFSGVMLVVFAVASLLSQKKEKDQSGDWNHMATRSRRR